MKEILLLKTEEENYGYVLEVLNLLLDHHQEITKDYKIKAILYDSSKHQAILESIQSLENDLNITISTCQCSYDDRLIDLLVPVFQKCHYGHYQFKTLLAQEITLEEGKEILNYILENTGVSYDVLQAMADCDLNVSKAASLLYMHRNTLLYKIDKLVELRQFDLRKFNDLYLLIKIMKS